MRVLQSMSTNYLILLFDITVEAATGGVVDLTLQLSISSPKQLKKTIYIYGHETADVCSIAAHVFIDLLLKIYPLFGQILITCMKSSRSSFSPSSYSWVTNKWGS